MDRQDTKELLRKYIYHGNQLLPAEIKELKELMTDGSLDTHLPDLWDAYQTQGKQNKKSHDKIRSDLQTLIRPPRVRSLYLWRSVAAVLLPLLILTLFYLYTEHLPILSADRKEYRISVEKGERASVTLPDGTKVYLNAKSTLSYSPFFAIKRRVVHLSGEAYFEVTRDTENPFIVRTDAAQVKVHGTTFNIYAYPENPFFEASLIKGRIEVISNKKPDKSVYLRPNQKVGCDVQTGELVVSNTDLRIETAWKRGDLIFRSQPLKVILPQLELFYGANIHVEGTYPDKVFTGSFHEDEINPVLSNLQEHYCFHFRKSGNEIFIRFK
ncbi:MAG: FecR domain-containing protein [Tannerellaceae bacterium]|jgi:ferric-dicitrate binding protein FerR (iron transport regulator)|nr:FecR domain-containing protein [Tannerellaceae bacterium]